MKALTNILSHLLMLLMLFIVACTEEAAEVENLSRREQYVTVRMNIPGMTATATRADDGVIESIHALAFDTNKELLAIRTATNINPVNANNGFNGTFALTVPNGTETIHFLANLPDNVNIPQSGSEVDVMTSLTTTDFNNLCYWGMTTTSDGNTNALNVTLYRNLAKISIKPSITDTEFNQFEQEDLIIAGLINPNRVGKLVPYNNGSFYQGGNAPTYYTLPDHPDPLNVTPIGNNGAGYGNSLYVFEHENSNYKEYGLFVICKIGEYFYNVALTSDGVTPYPIIRNHEYIIYVSDVDDYQTDEYRSTEYSQMYDSQTSTMLKTPINLEVKQVEQVAFSNTNEKIIDWNNGNPNSFDVGMTNISEGTVTLSISADGFIVKQGGNELQKVDGNYIYTGGNTTFTFTPTAIGRHTITINGTGTYTSVPTTTISVNVTASIKAQADKTQLYYDSDEEQTVTVNVTIPTGVETLNIEAADFIFGGEDDGDYTYAVNGQTSATLSFTLKSGLSARTSTITFSDASGNATEDAVNVNLVETPVVTFTPDETNKIMNINDTYTITMDPNGGTLTSLSIAAEGFTVASSIGGLTGPTNNVYTYAGGYTNFTFTPTGAGNYTISFYDGQGENINVPDKEIVVTVEAEITAEATPSTIYYDGNDKTVTVRVTIPKGVSGLNISATNFSYGDDTDGVYTYDRTDGATTETTVQLVFTLKDGVTEDSSITFSDANSNPNVTGETVVIIVEKTPEQGAEIEIWGDGDTTLNIAEGHILYDQSNIEEPNYYKVGATVKVYFDYNITENWQKEQMYLRLQTNAGNTFANKSYEEGKISDILEYTITEDDLKVSDTGWANNMYYAKLVLNGVYVTVTKISIIPASTTE